MKKLLIIFLKYPQIGRVKTRLAKSIGDEKALAIYRHLVAHTLEVAALGEWNVQLHWAQEMDAYPGFETYDYTVQKGDDLGARMSHSIALGLESHDQAVLIGSDIPGIHEDILAEAFDQLLTKDLVFGPAEDGGYYLVGARKHVPEVFNLEEWSHPKVLEQSMKRAQAEGCSLGLVDRLSDLDTVEDLKKLHDLQKLFNIY